MNLASQHDSHEQPSEGDFVEEIKAVFGVGFITHTSPLKSRAFPQAGSRRGRQRDRSTGAIRHGVSNFAGTGEGGWALSEKVVGALWVLSKETRIAVLQP